MALINNKKLPPPLIGFEDINRYWDKPGKMVTAKILPGEYYVTRLDEAITTVLGSCVSVCIRDVKRKVGGMNHFLLPEGGKGAGSIVSDATRYGSYAMEHLINDILKYGGKKNNLEFKVFGGGNVIKAVTDVGKHNIDFVLKFMKTEGYGVEATDVGDMFPRKIIYYPANGRVRMKKLKDQHNDTVINREKQYIRDISEQPVAGDVELF